MLSKHVETFIEVAESGSFSKAAQHLYVSTSAVIQQMNLMEFDVGVVLLNRTRKGITLTKAGQSFYEDMLVIKDTEKQAVEKARAIAGLESNVITVATSSMSRCRLMYTIIAEYSKESPNLSFKFVNRPIQSLQGVFTESAARDFGDKFDIVENVIYTKSYEGFVDYTSLFEIPLVCAVPVGHELGNKIRLRPEELHGYRVALMTQNVSYEVNKLRDYLREEHSEVEICDVENMLPETLSTCAMKKEIVVVPSVWTDCMPGFRLIETDWDYTMPYGFVYSKKTSKMVRSFIRKIKKMNLSL